MRYKKRVALATVALLSTSLISTGVKSDEPTAFSPVPDDQFHPVQYPENRIEDFTAEISPSPEVLPSPQITISPSPKIVKPKATPTIKPKPIPVVKPTIIKPKLSFILDREVSWYGPGFYGKRTACGLAYTRQLLGVAHRTLKCGTKVTFHWGNKTITVPVIDRGPYVSGRQWDLSGGLCVYLNHCFTGAIYYRIGR